MCRKCAFKICYPYFAVGENFDCQHCPAAEAADISHDDKHDGEIEWAYFNTINGEPTGSELFRVIQPFTF